MEITNKDYVINEDNKDEILNLLRNQDFILQTSSEKLEEIISNLDFKSLFNIIQNKSILDKIKFFRTNILEKDKVFFPNFLDTPILVNKTTQGMIYDMLNYLPSNQVLYYLVCPYIREKLNDKQVIDLIYDKNIPLTDVLDNDVLFDSIPSSLLIDLVNKIWITNPVTTFISKKLLKKLYNFSDEFLESINLDEVAYLFETIKTKDNLTGQKSIITVSSYKALITSYKLLGIKKTLKIIEEGNKDINVDDINNLIQNLINLSFKDYCDNNHDILHNMNQKILENVKKVNSNVKDEFTKEVMKNSYLASIINLMMNMHYASFGSIINILYNVKLYSDNVNKENELSNFCNDFVNKILQKQEKDITSNILKKAYNHFDLKSSIKEKKYRKLWTDYLQKLKIKLFIKALEGDISLYAFKSKDTEEILAKYRKMIKKEGFSEDVLVKEILIPLSKDNFNIYTYLSSYGITKPSNYDIYLKDKKNQEIIKEINDFLKKLKRKYNPNTLIEIINYVCYGTSITSKINKADLDKLKKLQSKTSLISGEFYINKVNLSLEQQVNSLLEDDYEIINYLAIKNKIESFIKKTINYLNYHMDTESIKKKHFKKILRDITISKEEVSFTKDNFTLIERTFSFIELENIFKDVDVEQIQNLDKTLEDILITKKILSLTAEGYLKDLSFSLGNLIPNWSTSKEKDIIIKLKK